MTIHDDHKSQECAEGGKDGGRFKLHRRSEAAWLCRQAFTHKRLRKRIEPCLASLLQHEHFSLLAGSGLLPAVHYLAVRYGTAGMDTPKLQYYEAQVNGEAAKDVVFSHRQEGSLEDRLRVASELLRGQEILRTSALPEEHRPGLKRSDLWAVWPRLSGKNKPVKRKNSWNVIGGNCQQIGAPEQRQELHNNDE